MGFCGAFGIPNHQLEIEWSTTPVGEQKASAAQVALTAGSITPVFPTGAEVIRAVLVASIHLSNQADNTHHVGLEIEGQKDGGGYGDLVDLDATPPVGLIDTEGASDGWTGSVDVTTLVDTSNVQYDFRFQVDSDNAGAVIYTTNFVLVLIYRIP